MNAVQRELAQTQAFILAGGQGERLYPLTVSRPKPAVPFGGNFRIIDFTLSNCLHSGLRRVSLLTQYMHEELEGYIRQCWSGVWDSTSPDSSPLMCRPPMSGKRYCGTADAVYRNAEAVGETSEHVLVLSGDHVYQMHYGELLERHLESGADLTIATVKHPIAEASHFGVVEVDRAWQVTGFQEKPLSPRPLPFDPAMALVSMGVYVFKKTVLLDTLREVCGSGRGYDFGHDVVPGLIASSRVFAYEFRDNAHDTPRYWRDIGTLDAYHTASMDLLGNAPPFDPYANDLWPGQATRHPTSAAVTRNRARVDSGSEVTRSVLSPGVQVEHGATIRESVLLSGVRVGKGARLQRAIVEEGVQIPAGFCAGFDQQADQKHHTVTDSGIVIINHSPAASRPVVFRESVAYARARHA